MKTRLNLRSYSRFPSASVIFRESLAPATFCCSCADQLTDRCEAAFGACDSPMREWLRNASSQSDSDKLRQVSSDAARSATSSGSGLRPTIPSAHAREPQHGSISSTAAAMGRKFQRASTSHIPSSHWRAVVGGIPRPDCQPPPSGISPWIECRQSAGSQQLSFFSLTARVLARPAFPSRSVPPPSTEGEHPRRCQAQCEHRQSQLQSRRREGVPTPPRTLSREPEPRELPLSGRNENSSKTFSPGRWLESAHRVPTSSFCSRCGNRGKACGARRAPTPESVPLRRPAGLAVNRQREMH